MSDTKANDNQVEADLNKCKLQATPNTPKVRILPQGRSQLRTQQIVTACQNKPCLACACNHHPMYPKTNSFVPVGRTLPQSPSDNARLAMRTRQQSFSCLHPPKNRNPPECKGFAQQLNWRCSIRPRKHGKSHNQSHKSKACSETNQLAALRPQTIRVVPRLCTYKSIHQETGPMRLPVRRTTYLNNI